MIFDFTERKKDLNTLSWPQVTLIYYESSSQLQDETSQKITINDYNPANPFYTCNYEIFY